ncbi:MAG TPA: ParA family protein [Candidatus Coatesbacteria bacterium]|nr:ParA family protein [Candidatus Coatesbacteria bacterium]
MTSGGSRLWEVTGRLGELPEPYSMLSKAFARLKDCDYIIFDCAPSLDLLTYNVLAYTSCVLIPVSMDYLSALSAVETTNAVHGFKQKGNCRVLGVLPTFYDKRTRMSRIILRMVKEHFDKLVTETIIRKNTQLSEAPSAGSTIFEHAPYSYGAADYKNLVDEVSAKL